MWVTRVSKSVLASVLTAFGSIAVAETKSGDVKIPPTPKSVYDFTLTSIAGKPLPLSQYKGHPLLIVNTASKCGYTKQYDGLEKLYKIYQAKGLRILGVPSNDFGWQEPGSNDEIAEFCRVRFGVTFDLAQKSIVRGKKKNDLYAYLTTQAPLTGEVRWNFEKFLIDKNGKVVGRYRSLVTPDAKELVSSIEKLL